MYRNDDSVFWPAFECLAGIIGVAAVGIFFVPAIYVAVIWRFFHRNDFGQIQREGVI